MLFGIVCRACMLMSSDTCIPYSDPWHHMYDIYISMIPLNTALHYTKVVYMYIFFLLFHHYHSFTSNVFSAWIRVVPFWPGRFVQLLNFTLNPYLQFPIFCIGIPPGSFVLALPDAKQLRYSLFPKTTRPPSLLHHTSTNIITFTF